MTKFLATSVLAIVVASGAAFAQAPAPSAPAVPTVQKPPMAPAATTGDAATDAKFKSADKDNSGVLDGAELTAYKADMAKIDTDKDGKISRLEFAGAVKSGVIK